MGPLDQFIQEIQEGKGTTHEGFDQYADSLLVRAHAQLVNMHTFVTNPDCEPLRALLESERPDTVAIYVPNTSSLGVVSPIQGVVTGLMDYADSITPTKRNEGGSPFFDSKEKLKESMKDLYATLLLLDPELAKEGRKVLEREVISLKEYTNELAEQRGRISNLSRQFTDYVTQFLEYVQSVDAYNGTDQRLAETTPIIAGMTQVPKDSLELIENFGLFHPNLIYFIYDSP
tara:strand:+ start:329 stop:1021 length:693 start_codon:yes stop_codon:yes gene_type:complete